MHSSKNSNCQIVEFNANPGFDAHANELVQVEEIKQHPNTNLLNAAAQKVGKAKKKNRTLVFVKKPVTAAANVQSQQRVSERSASVTIINPEPGSQAELKALSDQIIELRESSRSLDQSLQMQASALMSASRRESTLQGTQN